MPTIIEISYIHIFIIKLPDTYIRICLKGKALEMKKTVTHSQLVSSIYIRSYMHETLFSEP